MKKDEIRIASTQCPWCKSRNATIKNGKFFYCSRCSYEKDVSQHEEIKVIGWTTGDDNDFLDYGCKTEAIFNAIVEEVRKNGYSFDWSAHQSKNLPCRPILNNGYRITCGPRTWGSIMAKAHGAELSDEVIAEYAFCLLDTPVYPQKIIDYQAIVPFEIETED